MTSASNYDSDLGMKTSILVKKQLCIDIPRCYTYIDDILTHDALKVFLLSPYPRMNTQAVFAPIVEWFVFHNILLHEHPFHKGMIAKINTKENSIKIWKHVRLIMWDGSQICNARIVIDVHHPSDSLLISYEFKR